MNSLAVLTVLGLVAVASSQILLRAVDDGQWRPDLDGSILGSGALTWLGPDLDDGQWKPQLDNSAAGLVRRRRSVLINPNALPVPADNLNVALAKQAQLIQQNTEGTRNILGGGIPLNLPADTLEVAIGKQAHAIAHESQKAITRGIPALVAPALAAPALAAPAISVPITARLGVSPVVSPIGLSAISPLGLSAISPLGLSAISPLGLSSVGHW